ncbi:MAG: HAD-IC family P-type ATPase [Erysipelotrichaceae bacterium]|nr:HAD-IC family P-type ATPase [Erysipelotrichaceae bacterium]MDD3808676.1 HAD-IC family P-type ATPase [Erysipelotrichaceae bacterium]
MALTKLSGLSTSEVQDRMALGQVNNSHVSNSRSYKDIFFYNIVTFFNLLNAFLLVLVLSTRSYGNALFGLTFVTNTFIGIFQEIRAKMILDRVAMDKPASTKVVRDGKIEIVVDNQIVLNDVVIYGTNDNISVDCHILKGSGEINESLITGEANGIFKTCGDHLLSGSIVINGELYCEVDHVGADNYIEQIIKEAKQFRLHTSKLYHYLNRILKMVSIVIIPLGLVLFLQSYYVLKLSFNTSIIAMTASQIGMIPQGLVLLTSISLTIGTIILANRNVLVQELYSIETLARVDTLCIDKTGTLTLGNIRVDDIINLTSLNIKEIIGNMLNHLETVNETARALSDYFPVFTNFRCERTVQFNSVNKYSLVSFNDIGTYYLGAPSSIFDHMSESDQLLISNYTTEGYRVLALGYSPLLHEGIRHQHIKLVGLIILSDILRPNVNELFDFFVANDVDIKVISGDDFNTVCNIALKCGLTNIKGLNCAGLTESELKNKALDHNVFGRTTPEQKRLLVHHYQSNKKTVAMTGDGINDLLALKDADCSIALGSGSQATKNIANIILLDDDFGSLKDALQQGRRVINNISNSAIIYLIKTFFSIVLTLSAIIFSIHYPFLPVQLTLISAFAVGLPTFFLTYEPNYNRINDDFFFRIFLHALPVAVSISINAVVVVLIGNRFHFAASQIAMICVLNNGANYFYTMYRIYQPLNRFRRLILYTSAIMFMISLFILQNIVGVTMIDLAGWIVLGASLILGLTVIHTVKSAITAFYNISNRRK